MKIKKLVKKNNYKKAVVLFGEFYEGSMFGFCEKDD